MLGLCTCCFNYYCWWLKSQTATVWMYDSIKNNGINYPNLNWWVDPGLPSTVPSQPPTTKPLVTSICLRHQRIFKECNASFSEPINTWESQWSQICKARGQGPGPWPPLSPKIWGEKMTKMVVVKLPPKVRFSDDFFSPVSWDFSKDFFCGKEVSVSVSFKGGCCILSKTLQYVITIRFGQKRDSCKWLIVLPI